MSIIEQALNRLNEQQKKDQGHHVPFSRLLQGHTASPPQKNSHLPLVLGGGVLVLGGLVWLFSGSLNFSLNIGTQTTTSAQPVVAPPPALASPTSDAASAPAPEVVAMVPSPAPVITETLNDVLPNWVNKGHALLKEGNKESAIEVWTEGLEKIRPNDKLIALAVFGNSSSAVRTLKKISGTTSNAFVVQSYYAGEPAWRVMLWPVTDSPALELNQAQSAARIKGGEVITTKKLRDFAIENSAPPKIKVTTKDVEIKPLVTPQGFFNPQSERIVQSLNKGAYAEAVELIKPLLQVYPQQVEPLLWMGKAELGLKHYEAAEHYLDRALEHGPDLTEIWLTRGVLSQEMSDHVAALKFFSKAAELAPEQANVYFNLGYSYQALKRMDEAQQTWQKFLNLTDHQPNFAKQRAYVERRLSLTR